MPCDRRSRSRRRPQLRWCGVVRSRFCFFQAEDGIRDLTVTGVQTCALPICLTLTRRAWLRSEIEKLAEGKLDLATVQGLQWAPLSERVLGLSPRQFWALVAQRSEERRVGKECRSRWSPDH